MGKKYLKFDATYNVKKNSNKIILLHRKSLFSVAISKLSLHIKYQEKILV